MSAFFDKKMNKIIKIFEDIYKKPWLVRVRPGDDVNGLIHFMNVYCCAHVNKEYPVKFYHKIRNRNDIINLDVVFSSYESDKDDFIIKKTNNRIDILFYFKNWHDVNDSIGGTFIPGLERFKNRPPSNGPLEFTMCIPPDDPSDPNYNKYMKEFEEFERENPKLVAHLKEQCKGTDLEKFY